MTDIEKKRQDSRKTALKILNRYFSGGGSLKDVISRILDASTLKGIDRRFAFNLAKGSVRYCLRSDYLISLLSSRKIGKIDPVVLNILRMGIYQVQSMDSVPAYSAVDESVRLARSAIKAASGFVNAVMRKIVRIKDLTAYIETGLKKQGRSDEDLISILYSFPLWIVKYWIKYFGIEKTTRICSSLNKIPVFYVRSNGKRYLEKKKRPLLSEGGTYNDIVRNLKTIEALPVGLRTGDIYSLELGFSCIMRSVTEKVLGKDESVFKEAASLSSAKGLEVEQLYRDGIITIQDLSSQIGIKYFLAPRRDEKILDCCAAPGGKTSFSAQIMENTGHIVAVDKSSEKIILLEKNLERLGVTNTDTYISDASLQGFLEGRGDNFEGYFDRVIVDAPCTALGTIAKNPEVKYNRNPDDAKRLSELSGKILSACHPYIRLGGKIMFYTCTISPVENGQAVRNFIRSMDGKYSIASSGGVDMELEIMPYYLSSEGGYVCVLEKKK